MAVTGGFFNAVLGDRRYDAEDVNRFFDGVLAEGVLSTIGDSLIVSATVGMQVSIGSGKAWFLKSWLENSADEFRILSASDATYDRIDIVALEFDKTDDVRQNDIVIVTGTPSSSPVAPALLDTSNQLQVPLAHILVGTGVTTILTIDITNKRGTVDCPWATGLIDQISIEDLLIQWEAEFDAWMVAKDAAANAWMQGIEDDLNAIDTGDVLTELASMRVRSSHRKNYLINGDFEIAQRYNITADPAPDTGWIGGNGYSNAIDRWHMYGHSTTAEWTLERGSRADGRTTFKATVTTPYPSLGSLSLFVFAQEIEATMTASLEKGTARAKDATISFDFKSSTPGTYICEVKDDQNAWSISIPFTVSLADTWESFELLVPSEDTQYITPTEGDIGFRVGFCLLAGSSYQSGGSLQTAWAADTVNKRFYGQVNLAATLDNYFEISDVQFEIGSEKTDFERVPWQDELLLVQRFSEYGKNNELLAVVTQEGDVANGASVIFYGYKYAARKRAQPSLYYSYATITGPSVYELTNLGMGSSSFKNLDRGTFNGVTVTLDPGNAYQGLSYPAHINDIHFDSEFYMNW